MADFQVQEKTEDTSPSLDDVLYKQVDEADGATNKVKLRTVRDLVRGFGSNVLWRYEVTGSAEQTIDVPANVLNHKRLIVYLDIIGGATADCRLYMNNAAGSLNTTDTDYHRQRLTGKNSTANAGEDDKPDVATMTNGDSTHCIVDLSCIGSTVYIVRNGIGDVVGTDLTAESRAIEYEQTLPDAFTLLRFYASVASGFGIGTVITIIDPYAGGNMNPLAAPAIYSRDSNQSLPNDQATIIDYDDVTADDDGLVTTGAAWKWVAPRDMLIEIEAGAGAEAANLTDGESFLLEVFVNGTAVAMLDHDEVEAPEHRRMALFGSATIPVLEGDEVNVRYYQNSGLTLTLEAVSRYNHISIKESPSRLSTLDPAVRAKWSSGYVYAQGDITTKDGRTYKSLTDDNLGNDPATDTANWTIVPESLSGVIRSKTANNDATLELDISDLTRAVEFVIEGLVPVTDGTPLEMEVYAGGSWRTTGYKWYIDLSDGSSNPTSHNAISSAEQADETAIRLSGNVGSDTGECVNGRLILHNLESTTLYKSLTGESHFINASGSSNGAEVAGGWLGGVQAITKVRFKFGSGNIESGTIYVVDPFAGTNAVPLAAPVRYETNSESLDNASVGILDFEDVVFDDDGLVTVGGAWKYTAPHAMTVNIKVAIVMQSASWTAGEIGLLYIYKNGTVDSRICRRTVEASGTRQMELQGSATVEMAAGDYIDVRYYQNQGASVSLDTDPTFNYVTITEVPSSTSVPTHGWKSYTPTVYGWTSGFGTCLGRYKDLGNELIVDIRLPVTGAVGPGATNLSIGLPSGYQLDLLGNNAGGEHRLGYGLARDAATASYSIEVETDSTNLDRVLPLCKYIGGTYVQYAGVQSAVPFTWANGDSLHLQLRVPVTRT